ncbi:MAG: hypothetical protein M3Z04_24545 [Chloroflexota bacterium]|nr:hypothetical protein [Chloroflexota bacterium]
MRRPLPADPLARWADRLLRGFARLGAVAVAATGFLLRTRTVRRAGQALDSCIRPATPTTPKPVASLEHLAQRADTWLAGPRAARIFGRAGQWLDRFIARCRL